MEASQILAFADGEARVLFPGDAVETKRRFRELAREWHPDRNTDPRAGDVFARISRLHDLAVGRASTAPAAPSRKWSKADGTAVVVKARAIHKGSIGDVIVTRGSVAYETVAGFEDVHEAEATATIGFRFASDKMKDAMKHFLPTLERRISAVGVSVNVFKRPKDTVLMADLIRHMGGSVPAPHVAWLVSCLENMACYLAWTGRSHGALSPENILVCPAMHSIVLVGGWGFATPFGERPKALPQRTLQLVPRLALKGETVDPTVDLVLLRATAIELFGAAGAGGLAARKDIPDAMRTWLSLPPHPTAGEDYSSWEKCLTDSFGPRKFVKLEVNPADVYASA